MKQAVALRQADSLPPRWQVFWMTLMECGWKDRLTLIWTMLRELGTEKVRLKVGDTANMSNPADELFLNEKFTWCSLAQTLNTETDKRQQIYFLPKCVFKRHFLLQEATILGTVIPSFLATACTHLSSTALPCAPTAKSMSSSPSRSKRALRLRPKYRSVGEMDNPEIRWEESKTQPSWSEAFHTAGGGNAHAPQ